jgi:hypothetical protein
MTEQIHDALVIELGIRVLAALEGEDAVPFTRIKRRVIDAQAIAGARRMIANGAVVHRVTTHNRHLNIDADGVKAR